VCYLTRWDITLRFSIWFVCWNMQHFLMCPFLKAIPLHLGTTCLHVPRRQRVKPPLPTPWISDGRGRSRLSRCRLNFTINRSVGPRHLLPKVIGSFFCIWTKKLQLQSTNQSINQSQCLSNRATSRLNSQYIVRNREIPDHTRRLKSQVSDVDRKLSAMVQMSYLPAGCSRQLQVYYRTGSRPK